MQQNSQNNSGMTITLSGEKKPDVSLVYGKKSASVKNDHSDTTSTGNQIAEELRKQYENK